MEMEASAAISMWAGNETVAEGDLVILFETHNSITYAYMKANDIFQNRHGAFHHNDLIGQRYGTKVHFPMQTLHNIYNHNVDVYVGLLQNVKRIHVHSISYPRIMEQSVKTSYSDCIYVGCQRHYLQYTSRTRYNDNNFSGGYLVFSHK